MYTGGKGGIPMKKTGMILALTALCLLMTAGALAVELPPQVQAEVAALEAEEVYGFAEVPAEGGRWAVAVYGFDYWNGLSLFRAEAGGWTLAESVRGCVPDGPLTLSAGPGEFTVSGEEGFVCFALEAGEFRLKSYARPDLWNGRMDRSAEGWVCSAPGAAPQTYPAEIPLRVSEVYFRSLPGTPEALSGLATLSSAALKEHFPGWTLCARDAGSGGSWVRACWYRLTDGKLTLRLGDFDGDIQDGSTRDTQAIPVSGRVLRDLLLGQPEKVMDPLGEDSTFLAQDFLNAEVLALPAGEIVQNHLQPDGLILLMDLQDGTRRICVAEEAEDGYALTLSRPMPAALRLDFFQTDRGISAVWQLQGPEVLDQYTMSIERLEDGWTLSWYAHETEDNYVEYLVRWYGADLVQWTDEGDGAEGRNDSAVFGTFSRLRLDQADLFSLPDSLAGLTALADSEGWAVVNNPNPKDRLNLRASASAKSDSLAKLINRTPVRVLAVSGDWAQVRIGRYDGEALEGWMMTKYLAFGTAMSRVACAFPALEMKERYEDEALWADPAGKYPSDEYYEPSEFWVIGVSGKNYVIMSGTGAILYAPTAWFR